MQSSSPIEPFLLDSFLESWRLSDVLIATRMQWEIQKAQKLLERARPRQKVSSPIFDLHDVSTGDTTGSTGKSGSEDQMKIVLFPKGIRHGEDGDPLFAVEYLNEAAVFPKVLKVFARLTGQDQGSFVKACEYRFHDESQSLITFPPLCTMSELLNTVEPEEGILRTEWAVLTSDTAVDTQQTNFSSWISPSLDFHQLGSAVKGKLNSVQAKVSTIVAEGARIDPPRSAGKEEEETVAMGQWKPLFEAAILASPDDVPPLWVELEKRSQKSWYTFVSTVCSAEIVYLVKAFSESDGERGREELLKLSIFEEDVPAFSSAGSLLDPPADLIVAALELRPELRQVRFSLVPGFVSEKLFWYRASCLLGLCRSLSSVQRLRALLVTLGGTEHSTNGLRKWAQHKGPDWHYVEEVERLLQRFVLHVKGKYSDVDITPAMLHQQQSLLHDIIERSDVSNPRSPESLSIQQVDRWLGQLDEAKVLWKEERERKQASDGSAAVSEEVLESMEQVYALLREMKNDFALLGGTGAQ